MRHLAAAGLMLNTSKTVALTTEAQPPSFIQVGDSHMIKVSGNTESHKWLGCILCACPGQDSDVEYHLQQAAKAFQKHRWMLQCRECSIKHHLRYFEASVSSTACFAAQHRPLYRKHLQKYDVQFRKLIRRIAGRPPGTNWSAQWHDILHEWNLRVDHWARASGNFFLVTEVYGSILEIWFLHCKFTCRTLGEESTCVESTSNKSFPWAPTTNLGHKTGNVLHVQSSG